MKKQLLLAPLFLSLAMPVLSATQTATLSIEGMTCAACPLTVKAVLRKVEGVTEIDIHYKRREAVVTFDDAATSTNALTEATANAGYPSRLETVHTTAE